MKKTALSLLTLLVASVVLSACKSNRSEASAPYSSTSTGSTYSYQSGK